jgi:hypothetical protein
MEGRGRHGRLVGVAIAAMLTLLAPAAAQAEWLPAPDDPQIRNVGAALDNADVRDSLAVAWRAHPGRLPSCSGRGAPRVFPADLTPSAIGVPALGRAPVPGCGIFVDRRFLASATRAQLCWVIVHEWGHNAGLEHGADLAMAPYLPAVVPEAHVCFDLPYHQPAAGPLPARVHADALRPAIAKGAKPRRHGRPRIAR